MAQTAKSIKPEKMSQKPLTSSRIMPANTTPAKTNLDISTNSRPISAQTLFLFSSFLLRIYKDLYFARKEKQKSGATEHQ